MGPGRRVSAVQSAIDEIRERIQAGHWKPGDRLPSEGALTAQLGISRAPLREATRALVHAGLLSVRQGDGTYVVAVDETAVALTRKVSDSIPREVQEVRRGLDASAVQLAAGRRTEADLVSMTEALERRREAARAGDRDAFTAADVGFHIAVARAAHNQLLLDLYVILAEAIRQSVETTRSMGNAVAKEADNHDLLLEAIRNHESGRAVEQALTIIAG